MSQATMVKGRLVKLPDGALAQLQAADPALGRVIERIGPFAMRRGRAGDDFSALVRSIVFQQLSGKAAETIYNRVLALFPEGRLPDAEVVLRTKPERLRSAGLSTQKLAALLDLCRHVASGELPLGRLRRLEDEVLIERLIAVRGIGRWSAQMFLMFHLGRLDVWPEADLGVRKAWALLRGATEVPGPKALRDAGDVYRPYRTVASWYLWRSLDGDVIL